MGISTWYNITHGMREAVEIGYKSKDSRQRSKKEVADIWDDRDSFCADMEKRLAEGSYEIGEYRHFTLRDKKKDRDISVLPFCDRCVQNDIKEAIQSLLLKKMTDDMLGGLPQRGVLSSDSRYCVIRRMQRIMKNERMKYFIQGDISKFYDNIDNVVAMRIIESCLTDRRTLSIIRQHLFKQKKLAIGDPFSHLIANLVMSRIVRHLKETYGAMIELVNFADDIFIASESKEVLAEVRADMRKTAKTLRLHYKKIYIRRIDVDCIIFCGYKYSRSAVKLSQRTKKRYIRSRHKRRSRGSYKGIVEKADTIYLRYLIEQNDNRQMADKIRRPFAGRPMKIETLVGINHCVVAVTEKKSRQQHSGTYLHIQAIAEGLGLIVYSTSSSKIVEYLKSKETPVRDLVIAKDWSGYYYTGTVYTDEEEEQMIREEFNIH